MTPSPVEYELHPAWIVVLIYARQLRAALAYPGVDMRRSEALPAPQAWEPQPGPGKVVWWP